MKYVPHPDFSIATSALNFGAGDWRVEGTCDLFTIKAGGDKKLYKRVDRALLKEDKELVTLVKQQIPRERWAKYLERERDTPLGPADLPATRQLCGYLLAAMNSAHEDHDISRFPNFFDFEKESFGCARTEIDSLIYETRPHYRDAASVPPGEGGGPYTPHGSNLWSPRIWHKIDKEMDLTECDVFRFNPDEGQLGDGWFEARHFLFYNKDLRRLCYIYVRKRFRPRQRSPVRSSKRKRSPSLDADAEDRAKKYNPYAKPSYCEVEYLEDYYEDPERDWEAWEYDDAMYEMQAYPDE